jgi:hypothetical protein
LKELQEELGMLNEDIRREEMRKMEMEQRMQMRIDQYDDDIYMLSVYHPVDSHHRHRPAAGVSYFISFHFHLVSLNIPNGLL